MLLFLGCSNVQSKVCIDFSQEGVINFLRGFQVWFENRYLELKDNLENTSVRIIEEISDELQESAESVADALVQGAESVVDDLEQSNELIIEEIEEIGEDLTLERNKLTFLIIDRNINKTGDDGVIFETCPDPQNIITTPGYYSLKRNINGGLRIQSSDVVINLNDFTFTIDSAECPTVPVIKIEPGYENIEIINGKIQGNTSNDGIEIGASCQGVVLENVTIFSCSRGINIAGSVGNEVSCCKVKSCEVQDCTIGVLCSYAQNCLFENVKALNCIEAGFSQSNAQFNVFQRCESLETINNQADKRALGFASCDGMANLFVECIADKTTVESSNFCKSAVGFLLEGEEEGTKILNCIALGTNALSAADANAYGIFLNPIETFTSKLSVAGGFSADFLKDVFSVAWSPCEKYLASGNNQSADALKEVIVSEFTGSLLTPVASYVFGKNVYAVDWSPSRYLAVAGDLSGSPEIVILKFENATPSLLLVETYDHPSSIRAVSWSSTGKYLAFGDGQGAGALLFNEDTATLSFVDDFVYGADVYSVDWSPDGIYLAIGGDVVGPATQVQVYQFDGTAFSGSPVATFNHGETVLSVAWSPNGRYLAIAGLAGTGTGSPEVRVLEFDTSAGTPLTEIANFDHGNILRSVVWSPDGKYLSVGGSSGIGGGSPEVRILEFNGTSSLVEVSNYDQEVTVNSVDWSSGGSNLALGSVFKFSGDENNVKVFKVMKLPSHCVIEGNNVCNTKDLGIGISDGGSNFFINNVCFGNDVNLFNVSNSYFYNPNFVSSRQPRFYDNIDGAFSPLSQ